MSSLAEFLLAQQQPQFQTNQALLVIGLQNEFLLPNGKLPISTNTGFVDRIKVLVPKFRELAGDIIWIRSEFDAESPANGDSESSEVVVTEMEDFLGEGIRADGESAPRESTSSAASDAPTVRPKALRSKRKKALNIFKDIGKRKQSAPSSIQQDLIHEDEELYLSTSKRGACCIPGSTGARFSDQIKDSIMPSKDMVVVKSKYSAFNQTSLLISLRMKLITELYICGCMTNVSVYATIAEAARHGFTINIIEDCLGYRTVNRHELALSLMADGMGAYTVTSSEILEELDMPAETEVSEHENFTSDLDSLVERLKIKDENDEDPQVSSHDTKAITSLAESLSAVRLTSENARFHNATSSGTNLISAINPCTGEEEDSVVAAQSLRSSRSQPDVRRSYVKMRVRVRPKDSPEKRPKTADPSNLPSTLHAASHGQGFLEKRKKPEAAKGISKKAEPPERSAPLPTESSPNHNQQRNSNSVDASVVPHNLGPRQIKNSKSTPSLKSGPSRVVTSNQQPPKIPEVYQPSRSTAGNPGGTPTTSVPVRTMQQPASKKKVKSLANLPTLGPGDSIGERDAYIHYNLLPPSIRDEINDTIPLAETIFHAIYHEVRWQKMYHASGEVPRLVAVQGAVGTDGSVPIYRHPSDQAPKLLTFSKHVDIVRRETEKVVGHPLNHVLIQLYRDGKDFISEHSDKTLDIVRGSSIVNASFGAQRTMRLRTKKSGNSVEVRTGTLVDPETQRMTQRIPMPHNSCFVLGLKTNQIWLHGINADKRLPADRAEDEKAYNGMRISLTFRNIGTFLSKDETKIWGQGATDKSQSEAADVINGDEKETEKIIRAFGTENHESDAFDWDKVYGEGFDLLHFRSEKEEETKKLVNAAAKLDLKADVSE
ncbi:Isochorismatase hydrolase [Tothia fuscella]|uniref:Isochorismatase hydrolase n=1 Tax=Tothia fuscella TaxID=1048955 RepID=A0A9P4U431_9PEZI|nr:Isochorismatase hydrolase [Tothia fuscella]